MIATTYYQLDGLTLRIKCSFLYNKSVDILTIKKIASTNNPLSAPAFSLDRLEITYNQYDSVLISPKDKAGFINKLKNLNPCIEIHPEHLAA